VADRAGVSIGTASQALNNKANVSATTRARVIQAAEELGYQPQVRISTRSHKSLSTVGILVKFMPQHQKVLDPFYSHVLSGAERECQQRGLSLTYASLVVDERGHALEWPVLFEDMQVDGLIVVGAFLQNTLTQISQQLDRPIVLVDAYAPDARYDSVVIDNRGGSYTAVRHLIEQGHRHIGLIGSAPDAYPSIRERRQGYFDAVEDAGIVETYVEDSLLQNDAAYTATLALLQRAPHITAIFACNDDTAFGVMRAAHELDRQMPEALSVVGFDDMEPSSHVIPPLTTMHVHKTAMGALGVRLLIDRVNYVDWPPVTTVLNTELVIRDTVCPPVPDA
jgi:LacI family transcriptional regulator